MASFASHKNEINRRIGKSLRSLKKASKKYDRKKYRKEAGEYGTKLYGPEYDYGKYLKRVKRVEKDKAFKKIYKIKGLKKRKKEMRRVYDQIETARLA